MAPGSNEIYAATYSNVPVYEFNIGVNHVMRRRCDDYINATHILKVAEYDKPARTRILEREVQKGQHEKIQGGYGKYQGTWIPLRDGKLLAQRNNVFEKLQPIFDYEPSNVSPPPAPKHNTNSNKPKIPKVPGVKKVTKSKAAPKYNHIMSDEYDNTSTQLHDNDSQDAETIDSASYMDEDDGYGSQYVPGSRKRKRGQHDLADQQHMVFADALLDYFILSSTEGPAIHPAAAPDIPHTFEVNRPIDDHWHTALHWAVAMGDLHIVRTLVERGANVSVRNKRGETPLIRAVIFTNNFEKDTMKQLMPHLQSTITHLDDFGASVLHHTMMTTNSRVRRKCALYYLDVILDALSRRCSHKEFAQIVNLQDKSGDTALHIAAKYDAKKCVRMLQERGAQSDIHNSQGETADHLLANIRDVRQQLISSSPPPTDFSNSNGLDMIKAARSAVPLHAYRTEPARSFSASFDTLAQEKSLQIALALERDYKEKDEALQEAQGAVNKAELERQQIHHATLQLMTESNGTSDDEQARLQHEYATLLSHGQSYSEQFQHRELHRSIRHAEAALPKEAHMKPAGPQADSLLEEKLRVAMDLAFEQNKRRKMTVETVEAHGMAGMGVSGEVLKQLVAIATGTDVGSVVALAPELLEELKAGKIDEGMDGEVMGMGVVV